MTVVHLVRFTAADPDQILTQLRAYKERELDRAAPEGFRAARLLRGADERSVAFYTEWESAEALSETRESAPWEACMDLAGVFADSHEETAYAVED